MKTIELLNKEHADKVRGHTARTRAPHHARTHHTAAGHTLRRAAPRHTPHRAAPRHTPHRTRERASSHRLILRTPSPPCRERVRSHCEPTLP
eukprot:3537757-Prymnesium_polylepis.1